MSTLHCAPENGADLYVNERQKIRHSSTKSAEKCQIPIFYFPRCIRQLRYYSDVIHSFNWKSAIEHDGSV